uniref:uncharacterized protein LOC122597615 n=1 Tax=Erigeron canadensis TaxID=72917 RepID=UPI001CB9BA14|nr:uncharacterized protein LOC122597615 [Erigeron canadensis]
MEDLRVDARKRVGFSTIHKCVSAIRQLAYDKSLDSLDEYLHMGEEIARICLEDFCKCVFELYAAEYLRRPTSDDIQRLLSKHEELHGFPGMLGSVDCMLAMEKLSKIMARGKIEDTAPDTSFTVNGTEYKKAYYLADSIYSEWSMFVKSFSCLQDVKRKKFKKYQESARKDVERAFGVFQGRWEILQAPAKAMSVNKIHRTMRVLYCIT